MKALIKESLETVESKYDVEMKNKHQRLLDLGKYTPEELSATTKTVLYDQFKEHISTELSKELFGKGKSSLTKVELLEIIEYILKDIREERKVSETVSSYNPEELEVSPIYVITNFKNGVSPEVCAENSIKIFRSGLKKSNDGLKHEGHYQMNTLSVKISNLMTTLKSEMPDSATSEKWYNKYRSIINEDFRSDRLAVDKERQETVAKYGDETIAMIDAKKVEKYVKNFVAEYLDEEYDANKNWHLASFILCLTSGRRMIEIHGDFTTYEKVDNHTIKTVGLAKKLNPDGSKNNNYEHTSPVAIITSDEWLAIHNKLPEERKGCDASTVNKVISRAMSDCKAYRDCLDELGFVNLTKHNKKRGNYHNGRDFYISYMIVKNPFHPTKRPIKDMNYAVSLVAHEGKQTSLNYDKVAVYNI